MTHERREPGDEAERAMLGGMLRRNAAIHEAAAVCAPGDLRTHAHQVLYAAVLDIHGREGRPVDLVILAEYLGRQGTLAEVGGPVALAELWDAGGPGLNVRHHARIVAGRAALRRLLAAGQAVCALAEGGTGTAEEIVAEAERLVFAVAQRSRSQGERHLDSVLAAWEEEYDRRACADGTPGIEPCVPGLSSVVPGFMPGDLVILAARPAVGKTMAALALARGAAEAGHGVLFCSLEMPAEQLAERLLAGEAGADAQAVRLGRVPLALMDRLMGARKALGGLPVWIDDAASQDTLRIAGTARRLAARRGLGLVVVDYAGLVKPADPRRPRHEQVGEVSASLKALAKELKLPVLLLAQLNRELEGRGDGRPRLSDLRDSGSLEQDADTVVLLHRPDCTRDELSLIVAKQRSGPTGEASCLFDRERLRFRDNASPFAAGGAA